MFDIGMAWAHFPEVYRSHLALENWVMHVVLSGTHFEFILDDINFEARF